MDHMLTAAAAVLTAGSTVALRVKTRTRAKTALAPLSLAVAVIGRRGQCSTAASASRQEAAGSRKWRYELPSRPPDFESRFTVEVEEQEVMLFHFAPNVLARLTPPLAAVRPRKVENLAEGSLNDFELDPLGLGLLPRIRWVARHYDVSTSGFTDLQEQGPMAFWCHRHSWKALDDGKTTEVVDRIWLEHRELGGAESLLTRLLFNRLGLEVLFQYRKWATTLLLRK
ncbi:unnamed protein product [Polarella glacialis]|nr:unnamed protein product [Polarella glacialis]